MLIVFFLIIFIPMIWAPTVFVTLYLLLFGKAWWSCVFVERAKPPEENGAFVCYLVLTSFFSVSSH